MAHHVFDIWGQPNINLFAIRDNKCPTFVLPTPDARAPDTDALTMDWEGMFAYAFPPQQILPQVLRKFQQTQACTLLLIVPY